MRGRVVKATLGLTLAVLAAVAFVWIGRATADPKTSDNGYLAGVRAGDAQGRQEGRALQEGAALPANSQRPVMDAFNAGYAAGMNDAFGGGDGGWDLSVPYVVTLEKGAGPITYRIKSHEPLSAHVNYYLCADGHELCRERRP
jgi:hypothetical protein